MSVMTPVLDGGVRPVRLRPSRRPVAATAPTTVREQKVAAPVRVRTTLAPTATERAWVVLAHLSGAVSSAAGPMVISRLVGERSTYVKEQALAAANFQLAFLAALAPMLLLGVLTFGFAALFLVPLVLAWLLTTVLAALSAAGGERYRYPVGLAVLR
jgi:uncharacterized Tic20 family protein